jgi:hypothetical protein
MHTGAVVDMPFPRSIRDARLEQGLADEHHWVPGWITFRVENEDDLNHALRLMRLSPLGYALKTASDSRGLLQQQSEGLHLNHRFTSLFEPFVPKTANRTVPGVAVREHHDPFVCNLWNSISSR